jgi:hypothetical protein
VGPSGSREIGAGLVDNFLVGVWKLSDRIAHYRVPGHRLGPLGEGLPAAIRDVDIGRGFGLSDALSEESPTLGAIMLPPALWSARDLLVDAFINTGVAYTTR